MNLFDRIILWRFRSKAISRREAIVLRRTMRLFVRAHIEGAVLPELPRAMARRMRTMWIWAAYRVSVEQPVHFVLGVLLSLPAIGYLLYEFVIGIVRLIESQMLRSFGN